MSGNLSLYNQTLSSDDQFIKNFVARNAVLDTLVRRLHTIRRSDDNAHQVLIGSRGMGKTSMLRRLAIAIKRDDLLSSRFIPLRFREEQYNVLKLADFWRNCGESLAEWAETHGLHELADRLDVAIVSKDWKDDDGSAAAFKEEMDSLKKRPVLLIDNINLILDALPSDDQWKLRRYLQEKNSPIIVGAATQSLKESSNRKEAFYEFFQPHYLEPLNLLETEICMRALAQSRSKQGKHVLQIIKQQPERLKTLHVLTGGNPRVLTLIYRLLETAETDAVMSDLSALLDQVTPYYKARVEEYQTPQQRAVIDAIALNWDPVTTSKLAEITNIKSTTLSPLLNRLRKDGLIEKTEMSGSYAGHQIVERFLNIWYLMRHGTRRTKQKMRWLVSFLSSFYSSRDLESIANRVNASNDNVVWHEDYKFAFEQALRKLSRMEKAKVSDESGKTDLLDIKKSSEIKGEKTGNLIGLSDAKLDEAFAAFDVGDFQGCYDQLDEVLKDYTNNHKDMPSDKIAIATIKKGMCLAALEEYSKAIEVFDNFIKRFEKDVSEKICEKIAEAMYLKSLVLAKMENYSGALKTLNAFSQNFAGNEADNIRERVAKGMIFEGLIYAHIEKHDDAIEVFDVLIERFSKDKNVAVRKTVAKAMFEKGLAFDGIGNSKQEIKAYNQFIRKFASAKDVEIQEQVVTAMFNKALTYAELEDYSSQIEAFDVLIQHFEDAADNVIRIQVAKAMINKGLALNKNGDFVGEIEAYDSVVERFAGDVALNIQKELACAMFFKGITMGQMGKHKEEIESYDSFIEQFADVEIDEIQEDVARAMSLKGLVLSQLDDIDGSLKSFDAVINRFSDDNSNVSRFLGVEAMFFKGLTFGHIGKHKQEINTYGTLVNRFADDESDDIRIQVVKTLVRKAIACDQIGDTAGEKNAFDMLTKILSTDVAEAVRETAALSVMTIGERFGRNGVYEREEEAYEALIERYVENETPSIRKLAAMAMIRLGNLLLDIKDEKQRAEDLFQVASVEKPIFSAANLAWLYLLSGRVAEAKNVKKVIGDMPASGDLLLDSAIEFYADNFGTATKKLGDALENGLTDNNFNFEDDLERLLRLVVEKGYGERLLNWFEENSFADRIAPVFIALKAYVRGENILLDSNPEVRNAADSIFRKLTKVRI